jgi:peptidoglycan hydrolase-like protein with peptidoglycan-binding domain
VVACDRTAYLSNFNCGLMIKNNIAKIAIVAGLVLAASPVLASVAFGYGSSGGGGGGAISFGNGASNPLPGTTPATGTIGVTATGGGGSVLGASVYDFTTNLMVGSTGADVTALQQFLIGAGFSIPAGATGYFGLETKAAVMAYQSANNLPSTGFVGPLTRALLNEGVIPTTPETTTTTTTTTTGTTGSGTQLTSAQVSAIVTLLQSFGVSQATIAQVEAAL